MLLIIGLSICSAIAYALGGMGGAWWKNTKVRDWGTPVCALSILYIYGVPLPIWVTVVTFILMWAALSTYCTPKDQEDVYAINWTCTGLLYGLTSIGVAFTTKHWMGFWLRVATLGLLIPLWSVKTNKAWLEEGGRGFLFAITMPLLAI